MPTAEEFAADADLARRFAFVRQFGNRSTSYAGLQPGIEAFFHERGYLAFERFRRSATTLWGRLPMPFVLSDPVVAEGERRQLLDEFLAVHPRTCFLQVSAPIAQHLSERGHTVARLGVEIHLELDKFSLEGPKRRNLRQTVHSARRAGVQVAELKSSDVCARQVAEVSRQWVGMKKTSRRELRFLTRPPQYDDESDVRKFYAHAGDRLLGYGHFDPLYEHGQVIGYTANILRARPDAPGGTLDLLKVAAIEQFRAEGKSRLSLGLCPLAGLERRDPIANSRCAEFWARQFATRFKWLYSFPTLYFHKRRYDGIEEPVYATTNSRAIALNGLRIFQLCGVI